MIAGFLQFDPQFGKIRDNVDRALRLIEPHKADLLVLPELFNSGYQFISRDEIRDLSEEVPGGFTCRSLITLAKEKNSYIVAGLAERDGDTFYNSAIITGPGGFLGVYRKTHLFFEEKLWFSPGNSGFKVWETPLGNIGIMICSARTLTIKGADVIAHPSNLVLPYCPDAMITRCLENRVFGITANRNGSEKRGNKDEMKFIGSSEIVSPKGEVLARASSSDEILITVEINGEEARNKQLNQYNNIFAERRREHYL